jgi:ATP-dependent 26S proteasome regulatory subunit
MMIKTAAPTAPMPLWARQLSEKYYAGTTAMFVLHGNIHDLAPRKRADLATEYLPLGRFLQSVLFGQRDIVLTYDRGGGIAFGSGDMQTDFRNALTGYDSFHGTKFSQGLPRNPDGVLNILDNYLRLRLSDNRKIGVILDFAETLAPAGDVSGMSAEDRNTLVILKRWAHNPVFLQKDITIVLVTENLVELNQGIVQHPGVSSIAVPMPDEAERFEFLAAQLHETPLPDGSDVALDALAKLTAGLKRVQLQSLIRHASRNRQPLTMHYLSQRKKELIESESGGMLEFVQSKWNLGMVAGNDQAKEKLLDAAQALRQGKTDVLPMGYVVCGPVGTGKTFLTTCFAGECGIPAVTLKNFRSMWQGVTEGNLERVLALLKAMSPIVVIVDEADAQLGDRSSGGDSGVSNRVFAQIAQFMGNTEHRGKVLWFLLTCRPDLLPVDLKRQGRAEEHLALFYPDTEAERLAIFRAMLHKTGTLFSGVEDVEKLFQEKAGALSGADVEAIIVRAKMSSALDGKPGPEASDLKAAIEDFIPPSYPSEIELQNLVAVLECTSRGLLPEKYRQVDRAEVAERVKHLLALVGD